MVWLLQIKPFVLRRTKDQVLSDLPPKIIQDVYVEPSPLQVPPHTSCSFREFKLDLIKAVVRGQLVMNALCMSILTPT